MPFYMIEIQDGHGYAAERPVAARDVNDALHKATELCKRQDGFWTPTGAFRQVTPDEYLKATEPAALPAVVDGVLADMEAGR